MVRRRGEYQILTDILDISLKGVKVTHLMYRANLSYASLRKHLKEMSRQGLIAERYDDGYTVYYATDKGKLALERLKEVKQVLHV